MYEYEVRVRAGNELVFGRPCSKTIGSNYSGSSLFRSPFRSVNTALFDEEQFVSVSLSSPFRPNGVVRRGTSLSEHLLSAFAERGAAKLYSLRLRSMLREGTPSSSPPPNAQGRAPVGPEAPPPGTTNPVRDQQGLGTRCFAVLPQTY